MLHEQEIPGILPGPLALVTTIDPDGHANVAPKSWISPVTRSMLVIGCHRDHHTAQNLLSTGECVLNFPADELVLQTWDAHHFRQPGPGELEARGFTPLPALRVRPPRIAECRTHIEGRLESVKWYGDECILFIEILCTSVDAAALESPDPCAYLRPIFYLAPGAFGVLERSHAVTRKEA